MDLLVMIKTSNSFYFLVIYFVGVYILQNTLARGGEYKIKFGEMGEK